MRICYACGSTKTTMNGKYEKWRPNPPTGLDLCLYCYQTIITKDHYKMRRQRYHQRNRPKILRYKHKYYDENREIIIEKAKEYSKNRPDKNKKTIRYGRLALTLSFIPTKPDRCSVCGDVTEKIDGHHNVYVRIFPWYGREYICVPCHWKSHWLQIGPRSSM